MKKRERHMTPSPRRSGLVALCLFGIIPLSLTIGAPGTAFSSEQTIRLAGSDGAVKATFRVELATTPQDHARGLMHRDRLGEGRGMLFVFPESAPRAFWMKHVRFPLDLIYIGADRRIGRIVHRAPPCPGAAAPCPLYPSPPGGARWVLEVEGGTAERLGIQVGDRLVL